MKPEQQQRLFDPFEHDLEPRPWEEAAADDVVCAEVVFNLPLDTGFHYEVPDSLRGQIQVGQRLKVPFGRSNHFQVGYCVGVGPLPDMLRGDARRRLKPVDSVVDEIPLATPRMLELTRWIASHYLCGWGQVLETVIPAGVKNQAGTRMVTLLATAPDAREQLATVKLPEKQAAVMEYLLSRADAVPSDEIAQAVKCGAGPINALRKRGLVVAERRRAGNFRAIPAEESIQSDLKLNEDQQAALDLIIGSLRSRQHQTLLLHGVTGSGKTEVYIQAIREVVGYGRQAIVLVPEISLTPQTIRRFRSRFNSVAVLHSHLADAERHWHWQQIAAGKIQVIVGARSAVFAPTPHLGLIVIDEEHETSFKQDSTPRYHTREVARKRAALEGVPLILGSATPTLESWQRATQGEDLLVSMPRRVEGLPLPPVVIVDIRNDPQCVAGASIGRTLKTAMQTALKQGGQIILFLNLRGYSPVLWCRACGEGVKCPHCDVSLTWHKDQAQAVCHSCDYHTDPPKSCPSCDKPGLRYLGAGTQRLEQEVRAKFPGVTCLRMDSDAMRQHGSHDIALEKFRKGEVQILLGTQMIAKGLDFPNVTLVGVIDADTVLHQPDLRSAERTFHLIAQVAGRTGRGTKGGRVLVQSSSPAERPIVLAAQHDFPTFAAEELQTRRESQAPPYSRLMRVVLRGPSYEHVQATAREMAVVLRKAADETGSSVRILGPAPAIVARLKNLHRFHFQMSAPDIKEIQDLWRAVSDQLPKHRDVEYIVDVDPLNMR